MENYTKYDDLEQMESVVESDMADFAKTNRDAALDVDTANEVKASATVSECDSFDLRRAMIAYEILTPKFDK